MIGVMLDQYKVLKGLMDELVLQDILVQQEKLDLLVSKVILERQDLLVQQDILDLPV
jgi:hypothetical protein